MRSALPVLALALLLGTACVGGSTTGYVDLAIDADPCTRARAASVAVRIYDHEGELVEELEEALVEGDLALPTGVQLVPRNGDTSRTWTVEAELRLEDGTPFEVGRARGGYPTADRAERRLTFTAACFDVACPDGQTCRAGACEDAATPEPEPPSASACAPLRYVDRAAGDDADNDCASPLRPCATITAAFAPLPAGAGATVLIRGGQTYPNEHDGNDLRAFFVRHVASAAERLTLRPWPGSGTPILDGSGNSDVVDITGRFVTLEGLELRGGSVHGVNLNGTDVSEIVIRGCDIHDNGGGVHPFATHAAVHVNNEAHDILIEGSRLHGTVPMNPGEVATGLYANKAIALTARGNEIYDNVGTGSHITVGNGVTFEGNHLHDNGETAVRVSATDGLSLAGNRIEAGGQRGVSWLGESLGSTITDNRICGAGDAGIWIASPVEGEVLHNTIVDGQGAGVLAQADALVELRWNIFAHNAGAGIEGTDSLIDAHNVYFDNASAVTGFTRDMPDTDVEGDPALLGRDTCELSLGEGSVARGAGPGMTDLGARAP